MTDLDAATYGMLYNKEKNSNPAVCLVKEYQNGGTCYYRQDIGDQVSGAWLSSVKRNHYYQVTVTGFKGIGAPNPGDVNFPPSTPNNAPTNITATIVIDPWREVTNNVILEPR